MSSLPLHLEDQLRAQFRDLYQKLTDNITLCNIEMQEETKPKLRAMMDELQKDEERA